MTQAARCKVSIPTIVALLSVAVSPAQASWIEIGWRAVIDRQFLYATRSYQPVEPAWVVDGRARFRNVVRYVADYGTTTLVTFGGVDEAEWVSPLSSRVPAYLRSGAGHRTSYAFSHVDDYATSFLTGVATIGGVFRIDSNGDWWGWSYGLRLLTREPPRAGDGSADYPLTGGNMLAFLRAFVGGLPADGEIALYEYWDKFDPVSMAYLDGVGWSAYSDSYHDDVTITYVREIDAPPPIWLVGGVIFLWASWTRARRCLRLLPVRGPWWCR